MTVAENVATLLLFGALGALLGYVQFVGLRFNVELYVQRGVDAKLVGLHALRLLFVAAVFVVLVRYGAAPPLAALSGLLLMRMLLLFRFRRQS